MFATILTGAAGALATLLLGGLTYREIIRRRGATALKITNPEGIVEQRFVRIGGVDQWIQIRGEDRRNPVLLVLHGGPGSSYAVFTLPMRPWEKHFTIVQWDRRGVGKTLRRSGKPGSGEFTFERMVEDGIELAEFLRGHLGKKKLILLAGSMGNMVGAPLVKRRPDLFHAYVATDLYVNMQRNERLAHQLTVGRLRAAGNMKSAADLEKIGADPAKWNRRAWALNLAWLFRTSLPTPNPDLNLLLPLTLTSPLYSLRDVYDWFAGFQLTKDRLFDEIMAYDVRALGPRWEVPIFVLQGESDVITLTTLARQYYDELEAPAKGFALIPNAGHFAAFSQPEYFLQELLEQVRPLAELQA